jgi:hypothetical protein
MSAYGSHTDEDNLHAQTGPLPYLSSTIKATVHHITVLVQSLSHQSFLGHPDLGLRSERRIQLNDHD